MSPPATPTSKRYNLRALLLTCRSCRFLYGGTSRPRSVSQRMNCGYVESFNGRLQDELLKWESFDTLLEARVLIERRRQV